MRMQRVHLNIPAAHFRHVLSWGDETIDGLVDKAIDLAVRVGLRLDQDSEAVHLKEAERKGASIDWGARAAMFTRRQVENTIEVMRKTAPAPDPLRPLSLSRKGRDETFLVGNGANLLFDWHTWDVRPASAADLVALCQWAQGFDAVDGLFPPVMLKDVDQRLSPLHGYAIMGKYCRKTFSHEQPTEPIHVRYLDKMARVVEEHRGYYQPMPEWEYVNPPFRLSRRSVETMLARVDLGICDVMGIGPMSVSGMSAPVTVLGLAVTSLAEILAGLTFFNIMRPGFGLKANVCNGSLDLRTAQVGYFSMHTHLCNLATWELVVRGLGVDAPCLTWYREANEPGMQALYEFGMAQAFFSSVLNRCAPEIGGLACGGLFSPHQAVLDIELMREFDELLFGFEVSEDVLGLEEVVNARFGQGRHMATDHTLTYMQDGVPFSDLLLRGLPAGAQHNRQYTQTQQLMDKAAASVDAALARGRAVDPDEELGNELHEYVRQAAAELGVEPPPMV